MLAIQNMARHQVATDGCRNLHGGLPPMPGGFAPAHHAPAQVQGLQAGQLADGPRQCCQLRAPAAPQPQEVLAGRSAQPMSNMHSDT